MADPKYGVPDEENPEWTEEDFKRARRWRPGDPYGEKRPAPAEMLRAAARDLRRQADGFDREAERLEAEQDSPSHAAE